MKDEGRSDSSGPPRDICRRTFQFALDIVHLCRGLSEERGPARTLGRQLLRSGTSIGANVEEAQAGQSRADFVPGYASERSGTVAQGPGPRALTGSGRAAPQASGAVSSGDGGVRARRA
ncbi:MAG: four helix bundle protein [Candidatus Brocadiia bacterium]